MGEAVGAGLGILGFFMFILGFFVLIEIFAIAIRTGNTVKELREIKKILKERDIRSEL